jgi:hypothetical protein
MGSPSTNNKLQERSRVGQQTEWSEVCAEGSYQRGIAIKPSPQARVPTEYVRLWHKADVAAVLNDVRFRG